MVRKVLKIGGAGSAGSIGPTGPPGPSATPPTQFTGISLDYEWRTGPSGIPGKLTITLRIKVTITAPGSLGTTKGAHLYLEMPDQSSTSGAYMNGVMLMDGTAKMQGQWHPVDEGKFPYDSTQQPWVFDIEGGTAAIVSATVIRVYAPAYSDDIDTPLVQAGHTGASLSGVLTVQPWTPRNSASGINITPLLVTGVSASVDPPVTLAGKLQRPMSVTVDLSALPAALPDNWRYQILGYDNGIVDSDHLRCASGFFSTNGLVQAGPDDYGSAPHTFLTDEPTISVDVVFYAVSGLILHPRGGQPGGTFYPNNIVPGFTPSARVTIGTFTGVVDPTKFIQSLMDTSVGVNNAVFGVLPLGVDSARIALLAVDTSKLAALAVTAAKLGNAAVNTINLAALAVDAAALGSSAVTSTKIANAAVGSAAIANLAVGTGAIQTAAITTALISTGNITNALIANLAVGSGQIQSLSVGTAEIANLAVTDAKIASLSVTKLLAGTISVSVSLTAPTITITSGTLTINLDASNIFKVTDTGTHRQSVITAQNFTNTDTAFGLFGSLGATVMTISDGSNFVNVTKTAVSFNAQQVLTVRQTGPGTPSFGSLGAAQSWCQSLLTALQAHGLVT